MNYYLLNIPESYLDKHMFDIFVSSTNYKLFISFICSLCKYTDSLMILFIVVFDFNSIIDEEESVILFMSIVFCLSIRSKKSPKT